MLQMLAEAAGGSLPLDAAENESGNTATHIAAFGGCIELAQQLVCLGASVGLPNRDGFTPLDSMQASLPALGLSPRPSSPSSAILSLSLLSLSPPSPSPPARIPPLSASQASGDPSRSLPLLLLSKIAKPPAWTPDRMVSACQQCKLPFNRADPSMARKHHCRHCGRCVCSQCSPRRAAIPKFGSTQEERLCVLCERAVSENSSQST